MSEKTEQPTPKKLREARKQGQVARSRMLGAAAATTGGLVGLTSTAGATAAQLRSWTASLLLHPADVSARAALVGSLEMASRMAAPVLAGAFAASFAASAAVALTQGFQFNLEWVAPKLERVSPASGLKRLFSAKQLLELLKAVLVTAILGWIVWSFIRAAAPLAMRSTLLEGGKALELVAGRVLALASRAGFALLLLGGADFLWARRQHLQELMMTREERKEEHKNAEGNPHHKSKRKALHRQLLAGGRARGVQKATCIVVNPTHIAIALRYEPSEADAPYIVAKGWEEDALRIRKQAKEQDIPIVKDIPLARSLVHYDVGDEIPEELYKAAAVVLELALRGKDADARPRRRT